MLSCLCVLFRWQLFGVSEMPVNSILSFLQLHLSPACGEAVVIPYVIRQCSSGSSGGGVPAGLPPQHLQHFSAMSSPAPSPSPSPSPVQCVDILTYAPLQPALSEAYKESSTYSGIKSNAGPPPNIQTALARHSEKVRVCTPSPPLALIHMHLRASDGMTSSPLIAHRSPSLTIAACSVFVCVFPICAAKLCELFLEMDKCNRRRELLQAFSESPTQVLHLLVAQQAKDNLLMNGVTGVDDELERRAEYFHSEWIFDAMDRYQQEEATTNSNAMQAAANVFANADGDDE